MFITELIPFAIQIAPECCWEVVLIKLQFISVLSLITVNCPVSVSFVSSVTLELVKFTFVKVEFTILATQVPEVISSNDMLIAVTLLKCENNPMKFSLVQLENFTFSKVELKNLKTFRFEPTLKLKFLKCIFLKAMFLKSTRLPLFIKVPSIIPFCIVIFLTCDIRFLESTPV